MHKSHSKSFGRDARFQQPLPPLLNYGPYSSVKSAQAKSSFEEDTPEPSEKTRKVGLFEGVWRPQTGIMSRVFRATFMNPPLGQSMLNQSVSAMLGPGNTFTYLLELTPGEFSNLASKLGMSKSDLFTSVQYSMMGIEPFPPELLRAVERLLR